MHGNMCGKCKSCALVRWVKIWCKKCHQIGLLYFIEKPDDIFFHQVLTHRTGICVLGIDDAFHGNKGVLPMGMPLFSSDMGV